tara:strand:+ start:465 stop:3080 length:2616 start_codon:yes stop_codon:yes gene_type:complete
MEAPPQINLAIAHAPSFIANKKFIEHIPYHYVEQLSQSECLKEKWDLTNYTQQIASQNFINEREQLKGYLANYNKKLNGFVVKYFKPKHKWGRVFPAKSLGLTSFAKKTRNTLIKEFYYDFDLSNAQPQILRNICKSNKITHDIIEKYCNEREIIMADIITASKNTINRDDVKSLIIRLSFYGGFVNWMKELKDEKGEPIEFPEPVIVRNYRSQVQEICLALKIENLELYKTMERVKREKGGTNFMGSFLSTYLQEYELRIVEYVLQKLCTKTNICSTDVLNCYIATYEFDGLKLLKERVDTFGGVDAVLTFMNDACKEIGFEIKWELKPIEKFYDIQFIDPPKELIVDRKLLKEQEKELKERIKKEEKRLLLAEREELLTDQTNLLAQTDLEACDIIFKQLKDRLVYARDVLYYKKEYYWIEKLENIKSALRYFIVNSGIQRLDEYNKPAPYVQNKKSTDAVTSLLIDKIIVEKVNDEWVNDMYKSSLGKILFKNGYYDFHKGKFFYFKDKDYDHTIIFIKHIDYDFIIPKTVDRGDNTFVFADYVADVKRRLFVDPFGKAMADYYILNLARGLAGDAMKRILFGIGDADTGKSTITTAMDKSIGSYFGTFNGNNLAIKKFANNDEAQAQRWLMLLVGCRIIASNEIAPDAIINGEMLKKMVSGGRDKVVARGHGGNETEFNISFLPIVYANDLDKIQPFDDAIRTRVRSIPYEKVYKDVPSNEFELQKDKGLDAEILTFEFRHAFLTLLMDAYKTFMADGKDLEDSIKDQQEEAMNETFNAEEDFIKQFKTEFEITNLCNDFTTNVVIEDWLKRKLKGVSISKLSRDLKKFSVLNKFQEVKKDKKVCGKVQRRGWFGIKKLSEDELKEE